MREDRGESGDGEPGRRDDVGAVLALEEESEPERDRGGVGRLEGWGGALVAGQWLCEGRGGVEEG